MRVCDYLIIGGGPVGIYLAGRLEEKKADYLLLEAGNVGGQVLALYPEKPVVDVSEIGTMKAKEIFACLLSKVDPKRIKENTEVLKIEGTFAVTNGETYLAKAMIIATGLGRYVPRKLGLDGDDANNVHYSLKEPNTLYGKRVAIFGGGDSALDWAKELSGHAKVDLIHRRREFRGNPETIRGCDVVLHLPYVPSKLILDGRRVVQTEIENTETHEKQLLDVDDILVNFGAMPAPHYFGFEKADPGVGLKVDSAFRVSDHVYAVGDCAYSPDHKKRMAPGFREADIVLKELFRTF